MAAIVFPTHPDRLNYTSSPWSDPNGKQWLFVPAIEAWDPFLSAGGGGGGDALTSNPLSQFAATTSLQLKGVISDETGGGALVFATSPTLVTPALGTPASGNLANCTFPTLNQNTTGSAGSVTGLTVTSGKTLTVSNTLTLSGTDGSTLAIGTGGTLGTAAYTAATAYQAADAQLTSLAGLSYTGNQLKVVRVNSGETGFELASISVGGGDALTSATLDQFADVTQTTGKTLAITESTTLNGGTHSGTNTGDQTNITGNAGTVTGLTVTAGQTLNVTGGGTIASGSAAYSLASAFAAASSFIAGAGALTGPASPLTIGTAAGATLGTGAGQVPITGDYATAAHNHGAASGTAYDDQSSTNKGNLLKTDSFGSIRVNEAYANDLKMFGNDSRTARFYVDTVDVQLGASRSYKAPNADGTLALTASTTGVPDALSGATISGTNTLAENASIALDAALSAVKKYSGITIAGTAGATLAFGDCIYLAAADSRWELTDANTLSTSGPVKLGICVSDGTINDGTAITVLLFGNVRRDTSVYDLTVSAPVYLSATTAGAVTKTAPSGSSDIVRIVGHGNTTAELHFSPDNTWIELTA